MALCRLPGMPTGTGNTTGHPKCQFIGVIYPNYSCSVYNKE
jgi:hypothetical protein